MSVDTPTYSNKTFIRLTVLIAIALVLVALLIRKNATRLPFEGLAVGKKAPLIVGNGWLNGPGPRPDELKGKVVVVEAWATW